MNATATTFRHIPEHIWPTWYNGMTRKEYIYNDGQSVLEVHDYFRSRHPGAFVIKVEKCTVSGISAFCATIYN